MSTGAADGGLARGDSARIDPAGHYAILDLAPEATAAYRRAAKRLHPDMPETGNRAAFLRLQEAYQVLSDPDRRAAYDQSARPDSARPGWRREERELAFVAPVTWWRPRYLGLLLALVTVLALGQIGWRFLGGAPAPVARVVAMPVAPTTEPARDEPVRPDPPALLAGDHFIAPATTPAILWQRAPDRPGYVRAGQLEAFVPVALLRPVLADGYAEIRTAAGVSGFAEATRLLPGDAEAARRAACLYRSGAPPRGGALRVRPAGGPVRVAGENREDRPAVFKLRDARDRVAGAIYLNARGQGTIGDLPVGRYRGEFAVGDLWSAPCGQFMAGMRAQRLSEARELNGGTRFTISAVTGSAAAGAIDISDDEFRRE